MLLEGSTMGLAFCDRRMPLLMQKVHLAVDYQCQINSTDDERRILNKDMALDRTTGGARST